MERKPEVRIEGQIIRLLMLSDVCLVHLQQGETPESETGENEMVAVSGQYMGVKKLENNELPDESGYMRGSSVPGFT